MYSVIGLGSAALRTLLHQEGGDFGPGTKVFHIDTSFDDVVKDSKQQGYTVNRDEGKTFLEKERATIEFHIAGGKGGGMAWEEGRKILRREFTEDKLFPKLDFLDNTSICLFLAFAGNATGTNAAFVLQALRDRYRETVFVPCIGLPFREQQTEMKTATTVTLKEFRKDRKLPGAIIVDNAIFDTFADLATINATLAKSFRLLFDMIRNSQLFGFDYADVLRTIESKEFSILAHTKLNNAKLTMDSLTKLVDINQQFGQPDNRGEFAVAGVKAYGEPGDKRIKDEYLRVSKFMSDHAKHCKTALWVVPDGSQRWPTEMTALLGGFPYDAIRPEIDVR